jgi:hypothetical protein
VKFSIRQAHDPERAIAFGAWWIQMANLRPQRTAAGLWRRGCQDEVERVLLSCDVIVATPKDDPDDVVGVICHEGTTLHFVYTKFHIRRWKIATQLIGAVLQGARDVSFTTMPPKRFMGILGPRWRFDPFAGTRLHLGAGPFLETLENRS